MKNDRLSRDLNIAYTVLDFLTPARLRVLRERFTSPEFISSADIGEIATLLRVPEERAKLVKNPLQLREIRDTIERCRNDAITIDDPDYPALLRQIHDPPAALFCEGNRTLFNRPAIGIVGSRKASRYGTAVAERLGGELSSRGITVVSGLARGIDQAAHNGALEGTGSTIAVLGTGIDVDYPRGSSALRRRIASNGLMITEFPPGTPPRPSNFPVRNRILSGLSLGVIIIEANDRSGSLITARLAAEQDREVFAVPGSIFKTGSEGPHRLIQYGAKLVHDVDDVLDELRVEVREPVPEETAPADGLTARLLRALKIDEPVHIDDLATELDVGLSVLSAALFELEMKDAIRAVPGGMWVRHPRS